MNIMVLVSLSALVFALVMFGISLYFTGKRIEALEERIDELRDEEQDARHLLARDLVQVKSALGLVSCQECKGLFQKDAEGGEKIEGRKVDDTTRRFANIFPLDAFYLYSTGPRYRCPSCVAKWRGGPAEEGLRVGPNLIKPKGK
jgi:hypothetical protein